MNTRNSTPDRKPLLPRLLTVLLLASAVVVTFALTGVSPEAKSFLGRTVGALFGQNQSPDTDFSNKVLPTLPVDAATPTVASDIVPLCTTAPEPTEETVEDPLPPTEAPTDAPDAPDATSTPIPPVARKAPVLQGEIVDGRIHLAWTKAKGEGLRGYKVVASGESESPFYPDYGYFLWITNLSTVSAWVDESMGYNGGDLCGGMTAGETYWFAITAVYEDGTATSNTVSFECPAYEKQFPDLTAPEVSAAAVDGHVTVTWKPIVDERLVGYKVVASLNNPHPVYSEKDGYLFWLTDVTQGSADVTAEDCYNGGDFGGAFTPGTSYYFSVTAVYDIDGEWVKVAGNAVQVQFPSLPTK